MKACRNCRLEMHDDARLCPHCHGYQTWIANQRDPRIALVVVLPVLLLVVAFVIFAMTSVRSNSPLPVDQLSATVSRVTYSDTSDGQRIFVLGSIHNKTRADAAQLWLRIELFDSTGQLIDAPLVNPVGLIVPAHSTAPYRISALIGPSASDVAKVVVSVSRSKAVSDWD